MDDPNRRQALQAALVLGLAKPLAGESHADDPKTDRDFVKAAGMTDAEADCWEAVARAAGNFFALPELHPMDKQEVATAIHILQNKLLGRPTYRRYLELAKAAAGK